MDFFKELVKSFESFRHRHDIANVFQDWIELLAIEIANPVDLQNKDTRNERYIAIAKQYNQDDFKTFGDMLGMLTILLTKKPDDYLGKLYMQLELYNSFRGQYFTPMFLATLLGNFEIDAMKKHLENHDHVTIHDPACGSSVMAISVYNLFLKHNLNPQQQLKVVVNDIDKKAVHMSYIQLSLLGLDAIVTQGDALKMEHADVWRSPKNILGRF